MFDKEIEAIAKCTEVVKELDDDAKVRVVKYLIERFGIGTNPIVYAQPNNHQQNNFLHLNRNFLIMRQNSLSNLREQKMTNIRL